MLALPANTVRHEPAARAAYAKYECNHVYQTPSGGLGCHAPADLLLPPELLPASPGAKSLCTPGIAAPGRQAGSLKNAGAAVEQIGTRLYGQRWNSR
jgi:hypothetical protein